MRVDFGSAEPKDILQYGSLSPVLFEAGKPSACPRVQYPPNTKTEKREEKGQCRVTFTTNFRKRPQCHEWAIKGARKYLTKSFRIPPKHQGYMPRIETKKRHRENAHDGVHGSSETTIHSQGDMQTSHNTTMRAHTPQCDHTKGGTHSGTRMANQGEVLLMFQATINSRVHVNWRAHHVDKGPESIHTLQQPLSHVWSLRGKDSHIPHDGSAHEQTAIAFSITQTEVFFHPTHR